MAEHTVYAVDLAKSVFEIAVSKRPGSSDGSLWLRPPLGPALEQLDYQAVLLPPADTRRYVRRSKTDRADSRTLLEAFRNEDIRPVPVKTIEQQTLTSLHRLRSAWLAARTARINTLRGLLLELGVTIRLDLAAG